MNKTTTSKADLPVQEPGASIVSPETDRRLVRGSSADGDNIALLENQS